MLRLQLLGPMALALDGQSLPPPRAAAGRWLLAWLGVHPGRHPRVALASRFWPDVLDESARQSLRNALYGLRRDLGEAAGSLQVDGATIALGGAVEVDVRELDEAIAQSDAETAAALAERGELLLGFDAEWALQARDERRQSLDALLAKESGVAGGARALEWARRRARLDPLSEDAARNLMQALAGAGDRAAALAVYARLADRLRRELRVAPSAATRAVEAGLRAAAPAENHLHPALARPHSLTGRGAELAALVGEWKAAHAGAGGVVIVEGEAGIGKTRMAAELAARATADGGRVALGAGVALEGSAPMAPWAELLDGVLTGLDTPDTSWRTQLGRLIPRLDAGAGLGRAGFDRLALHEAAVAAVAEAARAAPLLLVFEDAHLADAASLALLAHLGRRLHELPVLLVVTHRPTPSEALEAATDHLEAGRALRSRLALSPLHPADARSLVAAAYADLDAADVHRAVAAADGNPLLAVETARALSQGHSGPPPTLRTMVRGLLRDLASDTRLLAGLVAVAGRALEPAEQERLPVSDLAACVTEAVATGLLSGERGRLGFRHHLLSDVAYSTLAAPRRRELHDQMATALVAAGAHAPAEIARHLRRAGHDERAVDHLADAARAARNVAALAEARAFALEAIELREDDPDLWLLLAHIEALRGRHDEMVSASRAALERIPMEDRRARGLALLARGQWLSSALCWPQEALQDFGEAAELLEAETDLDEARGELLAAMAWAESVAGNPDRVGGLLDRSAELGAGVLAGVHGVTARVNALVRQDRAPEALALADELEAALKRGRTELRLETTVWIELAAVAAFVGEHQRALDFVRRFLESSGGLPAKRIEGLAARAYLLARLDRPAEAIAAAEEMVRVAETIGDAELPAVARHDLGAILCQVGEHERGVELLGRALDAGAKVSVASARLRLAESLIALGRLDQAGRELRTIVLTPLRPADQPEILVPRVARLQGLLARAGDDVREARARFEEAIDGWRRLGGADRRAAYLSNLIDLGRPPVAGLTEPARELARVRAELEELQACPPSMTAS